MKKALLPLCLLLAGCATMPPPPMEHQAALAGAAGCFAQGIAAAADSGKGELVVVGIALMPLCAMIASSRPEPAYAPRPWIVHAPKSRRLVSRK